MLATACGPILARNMPPVGHPALLDRQVVVAHLSLVAQVEGLLFPLIRPNNALNLDALNFNHGVECCGGNIANHSVRCLLKGTGRRESFLGLQEWLCYYCVQTRQPPAMPHNPPVLIHPSSFASACQAPGYARAPLPRTSDAPSRPLNNVAGMHHEIIK